MNPMAGLALLYLGSKVISKSAIKGLPGFPGPGWTLYTKPPDAIVQRGGQMGQFIAPGGYYVEQTAGRWTLYAHTAQGLGTYHLSTDKE